MTTVPFWEHVEWEEQSRRSTPVILPLSRNANMFKTSRAIRMQVEKKFTPEAEQQNEH